MIEPVIPVVKKKMHANATLMGVSAKTPNRNARNTKQIAKNAQNGVETKGSRDPISFFPRKSMSLLHDRWNSSLAQAMCGSSPSCYIMLRQLSPK